MSEPTSYIVLRAESRPGEGKTTWAPVDPSVPATSAEAAIRAALKGKPAAELGTYVAVPARSWKPVTVRAEQQVVLKLQDAT